MRVNVKEPKDQRKEGEKSVSSLSFIHAHAYHCVFFSVCEVAMGDECKQWLKPA